MAEAAEIAEASDIEKPATNESQLGRKWNAEIAAAEKQHAKWTERAKKVEKVYNDERDLSTGRARKFNILWSNVETQRPAVYMQTPKCQAVRRYRDRDPLARFGAMLLERGVQTSCELYDFDHTMDQAVRDRLVVGRGQAWVFYEPTIVGQGEDETLAYESVIAEYVPWQDFLHSVARTWAEVWWVGRRFYKTRKEAAEWLEEKGLDPKRAATLKLDFATEGSKADDGLKDERDKAIIWEVWDKRDGRVRFVAPGSGEVSYLGDLAPKPAFRDFFPCPRPMLSTTTSKSLMPTPDYALYQDQAEELNTTQARIVILQKALKVAGFYNAQNKEVGHVLTSGDNEMVPVENWAMFAEGGGSKGNIEWFPVEQVAAVLEKLYLIRDQAKVTLYEVSGIGDILRGATDPDETATAQGIKAKWGSLRVRRIQKDVQRFAADIMRLKAEVIAECFSPQSTMQMAGVDEELLAKYVPEPPPQPQPQLPPEVQQNPMAMQQVQQMAAQQQKAAHQQAVKQFVTQAFQMLKNDASRNFRIDVETDSTLEPDQQEEKQTAVEFMTAMTAFMEKAAPMAMQGPEAAKLVGELLLFGVRRFDKVDELEKVVEQAVEAAAKPKPPPPNPEMMKVEAEIKGKQAELKMKQQSNQQEMQHEKEMHQLEMGAKVQEVQLDGAVAKMKAQQSAMEGQQQLALQAAQGEQMLRQGEQQGAQRMRESEHKMSIAERQAKMKRDVDEGGPPE